MIDQRIALGQDINNAWLLVAQCDFGNLMEEETREIFRETFQLVREESEKIRAETFPEAQDGKQ
jgi:hypothetical protein